MSNPLRRTTTLNDPRFYLTRPDPSIVEESPEFLVDRIVDHKKFGRNGIKYLLTLVRIWT